jgi:hypothetical protein
MRDGNINKPKGRSYNAAFSAWQKKYSFESLDKGDRSRLLNMMDHRKEIDDWLQTLPESERLRLNHPSSVWRRWKGATSKPKEQKISAMQKLKDELIKVEEENHRLRREIDRGGGDLRPQAIAKVIVTKFSKYEAEIVAHEIVKMLKETQHEEIGGAP